MQLKNRYGLMQLKNKQAITGLGAAQNQKTVHKQYT